MPSPENPLRFIQITDTHINPERDYIKDYASYTPMIGVEALIREINSLPYRPDFILHTGDVAYDPVADVYPYIKELMSQIEVPVYYLAGNHDDAKAIQSVLMGIEQPKDYLYYDFDAKGVHVVCLDSNGPTTQESPFSDPPAGTVTQEQLDWLNEICSSDDERPLVIAVHHNAIPVQVPWLDTWMRMENGEVFHEIVRQARDRLCAVLYGHIHQNFQVLRDGVLYVSGGSSWCQFISYPMPENTMHVDDRHTLPSFNMITISGETTSINRHSFTVNADDV